MGELRAGTHYSPQRLLFDKNILPILAHPHLWIPGALSSKTELCMFRIPQVSKASAALDHNDDGHNASWPTTGLGPLLA